MMKQLTTSILLCAALLGGAAHAHAVELPTGEEAAAVLGFLNSPTTTVAVLDELAGLDRRAAFYIISRRNGPDGAFPSADDRLFEHLDEVDDVPYVGPYTLLMLRDYVVAGVPAKAVSHRTSLLSAMGPLAGTFDGEVFDETIARTALIIANEAPRSELIGWGGIWPRSASVLVVGRPFTSLAEVAATPGIGPKTMSALKRFAVDGWRVAGDCVVKPAVARVPEVAAWNDALTRFDMRESAGVRAVRAWRLPACADATDSRVLELLMRHVIEDSRIVDAPRSPRLLPTRPGSDRFAARIAEALRDAETLRDELTRAGAVAAHKGFAIVASAATDLDRVLSENRSAKRELAIDVPDWGCPVDLVVVVDPKTRTMLAVDGACPAAVDGMAAR